MGRDNRNIQQPELGEYIQKLIPRKLEDEVRWAGSIEFNFAQFINEKGYVFPIPGLKTNETITYKIKTNADLDFKAGDIIRFGRDDRRRWTIQSVDISTEDKNYRRSFLYPDDTEAVSFKIITFSS